MNPAKQARRQCKPRKVAWGGSLETESSEIALQATEGAEGAASTEGSEGAAQSSDQVDAAAEYAVASVDDREFTSIDEAISHWQTNGGTLTLFEDAQLGSSIADGAIKISKTASLNLRGCTLSLEDHYFDIASQVTMGADFDDWGSGTITSTSKIAAIRVNASGAVLSLRGVNLSDETAIKNSTGSLVVASGKAVIESGEIDQLQLKSAEATIGLAGEASGPTIGTLKLSSSSFKCDVLNGYVGAFSGNYKVTSVGELARFGEDPSSHLPANYRAVKADGSDTEYRVVPLSPDDEDIAALVIRDVNTYIYLSVKDALSDIANNGGCLKLMSDQANSSTTYFSIKSTDAVLDLNGKTLSLATTSKTGAIQIAKDKKLVVRDSSSEGTGVLSVASNCPLLNLIGSLVIESGKITSIYDAPKNPLIQPSEGSTSSTNGKYASLTIAGGTIVQPGDVSAVSFPKGKITMTGGSVESVKGSAISVTGGSLDMEGGKVSGQVNGIRFSGSAATLSLLAGDVDSVAGDSGTLTLGKAGGSASDLTVQSLEGISATSNPTIILNSGTLGTCSFTNASFKFSDESAFSNSLRFQDASAESYLPEGYNLKQQMDGSYIVQGASVKDIAQVEAPDGTVTAYSSLAKAMVDVAFYAKDGATVKLLGDVDITDNGFLSVGAPMTLDLNGYSIKAANNQDGNIQVWSEGKLTLVDSSAAGAGKIYTESKYDSKVNCMPVVCVYGGEFIMQSGTIDAASFTTNPTDEGNFAVGVYCYDNQAPSVSIEGGAIKAGWYCVAGSGAPAYNGEGASTNISISGGTLESVADYAIYLPQKGATTISNGVIYGAAGGVMLNRGTLDVTGGTITSKGTGSTGSWGDGTGSASAAAINVNAGYGDTSVKVSGGTVTAEQNALVVSTETAHNATLEVSGGAFSSEIPTDYCADGYVPTKSTDASGKVTYGVAVDTASGLGLDVAQYRFSDAYTAPAAAESGMVFAGWYTDTECTTPLGKDVTTGAAYPKFVEISKLINFEGGSLRMDVGNPATSTYLRFGYSITVPANCRYVSNSWDYYMDASDVRFLKAYNNMIRENGTAMSNLVIPGVSAALYEKPVYSQMSLTFKTADGTTVTAKEGEVQHRTVREVAEKILANPMATDDEIAYAEGVVAACETK